MMKRMIITLFCALLYSSGLAASTSSFLQSPGMGSKIAMQNRVLTRVGDKTITTRDVMEKMALFLHNNYPEESKSPLARTQFYISSWKQMLGEMINHELILADAQEMKIKVSDKEVREELLAKYGVNILETLDTLGVSYEAAKKLTHDEMAIERMKWFRVQSKALHKITPKHIKEAYHDYLLENPETTELEYQVLSIRSTDKSAAKALADQAASHLRTNIHVFSALPKLLPKSDEVSVSLSQPISVKDSELSEAHKSTLSALGEGEVSAPVRQVSRFDNSEVYRIFFLQKITTTKPLPFNEMETTLKNKLFAKAATEQNEKYVAKLRDKYGYGNQALKEAIPDDYQPFSIQ